MPSSATLTTCTDRRPSASAVHILMIRSVVLKNCLEALAEERVVLARQVRADGVREQLPLEGAVEWRARLRDWHALGAGVAIGVVVALRLEQQPLPLRVGRCARDVLRGERRRARRVPAERAASERAPWSEAARSGSSRRKTHTRARKHAVPDVFQITRAKNWCELHSVRRR